MYSKMTKTITNRQAIEGPPPPPGTEYLPPGLFNPSSSRFPVLLGGNVLLGTLLTRFANPWDAVSMSRVIAVVDPKGRIQER
jgi:hypothetical protein